MSKKLKTRLAAIPAFVLATVGTARAALPTEVDTAVDTATADLKTAATALVVGMLGFWGIRKLGQKLGWW